MWAVLKPWRLPGPSTFVGRVCTDADRAKLALLHAPCSADKLVQALHEYLIEDGRYATVCLDLSGGCGFSGAAAAETGLPPTATPAALATAPALSSTAFIVTIQGPAPPDLATYARLIARQPAGDGAILIVVSKDGECHLDGCEICPVRDVFGPLDGAAYAAAMPRNSRPLESRLVASVAIEVAAWDVPLLDLLTALPVERAVRPDLHVEDWEDERRTAWTGTSLSWAAGCLDDWGGEQAEHALWLAANKPAGLTKRVWRGQMGTLLPWIEQQRLNIIEREWRWLRPDRERSGPDVELLDWGPLSFQLERGSPELKRLLQVFRFARNELAHARPISWQDIRACIDSVRAYEIPQSARRGR